MMNVPNMLTFFRLLLLPLMLLFFYLDFANHYLYCALLFIVIAITDFLDGYLARKLNQQTKFGAFIDPVADKIVVGMSYILIGQLYQNVWVTLAVIVIIGREITISALREWMASQGSSKTMAVATIGKWKTTMQMLGVVAMFAAAEPYLNWGIPIAYIILAVATVLTMLSMYHYFQKAWAKFR
jgi:CDP-diacylglycerol--glycerol-3-phosphate 3-phosphatidyltransferase